MLQKSKNRFNSRCWFTLELHNMIIVLRSIFHEGNKYYPQVGVWWRVLRVLYVIIITFLKEILNYNGCHSLMQKAMSFTGERKKYLKNCQLSSYVIIFGQVTFFSVKKLVFPEKRDSYLFYYHNTIIKDLYYINGLGRALKMTSLQSKYTYFF